METSLNPIIDKSAFGKDALSISDFFLMVEKSPDIIARFDLDNRCIYMNEACEEITGYTRNEIVGKFLRRMVGILHEQIRLIEHDFCLVIETGLPIEFDIVLPHANTRLPVHLQVIVQLVPYAEYKRTGVMVVAHDITEQKHAEEELVIAKNSAEESSRVISFLRASISNEMLSPLNMVIGLSHLLKDETLSLEELNEYVDLIDESGKKLVRMVEDILELSKMESGQIEINIESYYAETIIKELYLETGKMLRESRKNEIGVRYMENRACANTTFFGDTKHVKQVLHILADNAVKFTHKGEITIGIYDFIPGQLTFYISDTGIGIPEEKQKSIFEPFVQTDFSLRRAFEGLGIGLSLARRIARALGGDITLISKPGEGTTFFFSLPTICGLKGR